MDRRRFLVSATLVPPTAIAGPIKSTDVPSIADLAFDLKLIAWSSKECLSFSEGKIIDDILNAMSQHVPEIEVTKKAFHEELGISGGHLRFWTMDAATRAGAMDRPTFEKLTSIAC